MVKVPKNWPAGIKYMDEPQFHSSITRPLLTRLCSNHDPRIPRISMDQQYSGVNKWVHIESIALPSHPAHGQCGLFASRKIPPNTLILFYIGEVHAETRETSDYDLSLLKTTSDDGSFTVHIGIDAQCMGNEARFINDYRGVKERPNAVFKEVVVVVSNRGGKGDSGGGELRMSVWSGSKPIGKGDEIVVSYGKGWWLARHGVESQQELEQEIESRPLGDCGIIV
ncbi:hypothetical protein CPB86DRAFT_780712 [Serendipita vermifera]|nr:hypothetical protein CPB86DRAFT_780712 [Serendipita vermifera]